MTYHREEFIWEREEELLDFLRNNMSDPLTTRGSTNSQSFTATGGTDEEFTITDNVLIKNITSVTQGGSTLKRGHDYTVAYGEDGEESPYNRTIVTIRSTTADDAIVINYKYGETYIHEGFTVDGKQLPLCILQQLSNNPEYTGVGEGFDSGKSQYVNGSYLFEVRDKYQRRCKKEAHEAFNLVAQYRHNNAFRLREVTAENLSNLDYDKEKRAWVFQFTIRIQWEVPFQ